MVPLYWGTLSPLLVAPGPGWHGAGARYTPSLPKGPASPRAFEMSTDNSQCQASQRCPKRALSLHNLPAYHIPQLSKKKKSDLISKYAKSTKKLYSVYVNKYWFFVHILQIGEHDSGLRCVGESQGQF